MVPDPDPVGSSWLPAQIEQDKVFKEKYLIERELGVGGSGVVVCARHRELDERVAIKFLLPGPRTTESLARFRLEARAANRIKNEHVVRIFDVATTEGGIPYIVMEYLEGLDLERKLQTYPQRQLPVPDAIDFILQACEAVAESHALEIVHRDLKPSNLFCVRGADGLPMIKVLDFGISKLGSVTIDGDISGGCRVLGSPRYMSPEQFESSTDVDRRTDIWAIGVILYELLTGVVPFAEVDLFRLRQRIREEELRSIRTLRDDLPVGLAQVVGKCLEKNRGKRYPNLAELGKALYPFAPQRARASITRIVRIVEAPGCTTGALALPADAVMSDTPTVDPVPAVSGRRRRWRKLKALALVAPVVLGVIVLVFAWFSRPASVNTKEQFQPGESSAELPREPILLEQPVAVQEPSAVAPVAPTVTEVDQIVQGNAHAVSKSRAPAQAAVTARPAHSPPISPSGAQPHVSAVPIAGTPSSTIEAAEESPTRDLRDAPRGAGPSGLPEESSPAVPKAPSSLALPAGSVPSPNWITQPIEHRKPVSTRSNP